MDKVLKIVEDVRRYKTSLNIHRFYAKYLRLDNL